MSRQRSAPSAASARPDAGSSPDMMTRGGCLRCGRRKEPRSGSPASLAIMPRPSSTPRAASVTHSAEKVRREPIYLNASPGMTHTRSSLRISTGSRRPMDRRRRPSTRAEAASNWRCAMSFNHGAWQSPRHQASCFLSARPTRSASVRSAMSPSP